MLLKMATEYGSRLAKARKFAKLTQMQLSAKTGIAQSTISTAEREGKGSTDTAVYAAACGVSALWLETGVGQMEIENATVRISGVSGTGLSGKATTHVATDLVSVVDALLEKIAQTDQTDRAMIGSTLAALTANPQDTKKRDLLLQMLDVSGFATIRNAA